ncbi:putative cysteine-rich receptor-like protein kinase 30 isoform X3 [Tripterygium wilfordii]|uniref:putative cysteine-rich receptor-like protein kinase 30 isoform X3 n=1 Tax=Tripterygium wilfordii TaxID=458696 RepID=UPI0018F81868|nr:putative cysteine-rich receptor-like protein kinase 30 isoform X3 [Tripterygium wilfordii]
MGFSWQCTPDVSRSDCSYCLKENVGYFYRCCHKKQGGFVRRPSCIFRWNLYPFYNSTTADPPAPSPPGSTNTTSINDDGSINHQTIVAIVVPTFTVIALVAVACIFFFSLEGGGRSGWRTKFSFEKML